MNNYLNRAIDWLCLFLFLILISFPIFQILGRYISFFSIPASQEIVQHMTLWIGFIGAVIAARSNKLLSVVRDPVFDSSTKVDWPKFFVHVFSLSIVFVLSISYLKMIQIGFQIDIDDIANNYVLIIKDEGPGFNEASTEKIFKRFYSNRPENFGEHSGLGLNIVKNIVELHKGAISAANRSDSIGAQIEVLLPKFQ